MIDLAEALLRKSLRARATGHPSCGSCRRTPVPGELMHVYEDRSLCALCARSEAGGEPLRRERVGASERRLAIAPLARAA